MWGSKFKYWNILCGEPVLQPWHNVPKVLRTLVSNHYKNYIEPLRFALQSTICFKRLTPLHICQRWRLILDQYSYPGSKWTYSAPRELALFSLVAKRLGGVDCDLPARWYHLETNLLYITGTGKLGGKNKHAITLFVNEISSSPCRLLHSGLCVP